MSKSPSGVSTTESEETRRERYFHLHDPDGHELSFAQPLR
jgi:hypothetical protein